MQYAMNDDFNYEPVQRETIAALAAAKGVSGDEFAYDLLMEDDGTRLHLFAAPQLCRRQSGFREGLARPRRCGDLALRRRRPLRHDLRRGVADLHAAALGARPRARDAFRIELAIKRQCRDTALLYGMADRGLLAEGYLADVNVIDMERLKLGKPWLAFDLPAGGKRLLQKAVGYVATIKSGQITFRNGEVQGARPGRVIRGPQRGPLAMAAE